MKIKLIFVCVVHHTGMGTHLDIKMMAGTRYAGPGRILGMLLTSMLATPAFAQTPAVAWPVSVASTCVLSASASGWRSADQTGALSSAAKSAAILGGAPSRLAQIQSEQRAGASYPGGTATLAGLHTTTLARRCERAPSMGASASPFAGATRAFEIARPGQPDVFGSVALGVSRTPLDAKWHRVRHGGLGYDNGPWAGLLRANRAADRTSQIAAVNAWVNRRIVFTDDSRQHARADHWATADESLRRGRGDCEDYAIAKMQLLKALGVPSQDVYLVLVRDLVRRADHAVLVVRDDGRLVVLDNETDRIVDARFDHDYRPVITFSDARTWTHGYRTRQPAIRTAALSFSGGR